MARPAIWPLFRDEILKTHPSVTASSMEQARTYNFERYRYQGIGRYEPAAVFERGLADLQALATLIPDDGFVFGPKPSSIDAGIYGFVANIHFYQIDTPLRTFVASHPNLVRHCNSISCRGEGVIPVSITRRLAPPKSAVADLGTMDCRPRVNPRWVARLGMRRMILCRRKPFQLHPPAGDLIVVSFFGCRRRSRTR